MSFFKNLDWGNWFLGMWIAIATGVSTAGLASIALYFQKPNEHNPLHAEFWISGAIIMAMTSGKDFFLYLNQNPAPKFKKREETVEVTKPTAKGGTVTATTKDTSVVPIDEPLPGVPKPAGKEKLCE